jgi:hypothetical protein
MRPRLGIEKLCGRLVGIVSIGDVVNYRLREMELEANALHEYILTA